MRWLMRAVALLSSASGLAACGSVVPPPPNRDSGMGTVDGGGGVDAMPDGGGGVDAMPDGGGGVDAMPVACMPQPSHAAAVFHIILFANAKGYSGTDSSCPMVGESYTTSNPQFVWCRRFGGVVSGSQGFNHWWLWTQLDDPPGQLGWISAYYIQGQGNDEANDKDTGQPIDACP